MTTRHTVGSLLRKLDRVAHHLGSDLEAAKAVGDANLARAGEAIHAWWKARSEASGNGDRAEPSVALRDALTRALDDAKEPFEKLPDTLRAVVDALSHVSLHDDARTHELVFWVNGDKHVVRDPDPRTLLVDYLRSAEVGLTGTKKVCAQGGCGACTVTLERYDPATRRVDKTAINSCLRPLCAVDGMAITTIEGIGSIDSGLSPVQYQLAIDNGTQCGYCTPGWVMNMHSYLVGQPDAQPTQAEIEQLFDGNLCRCTGFRPILYAMRHFASDWDAGVDGKGSMTCKPWPTYDAKTGEAFYPSRRDCEPNPPPPVGLEAPPVPLRIERGEYRWLRVLSLDELEQVLRKHGDRERLRLVIGNTSIGIYGEPAQDVCYGPPFVRVDISCIPELHGCDHDEDGLRVGAATTYTQFLTFVDGLLGSASEARRGGLEALRYMAHRTAGKIVRDAASLAGNTMLVVQHVNGSTLAPFPSDMFTALCMIGAQVDVTCPGWDGVRRMPMLAFAEAWQADADLQRGAVLLRYAIPWTREREHARTFKVALREVNAHSIVNAGFRVRFDERGRVEEAHVVYGGIGPIAFHARELEAWMVGRAWDAELLAGAIKRVAVAVRAQLEATAPRMASVPDEGFTAQYRVQLAESFFFQYFVWLASRIGMPDIPEPVQSSGVRFVRPVSRGTQAYRAYEAEYPVNEPYIKAEAFMQVSGQAVYTHDTPVARGGLEGAPVISTRALAEFSFAYEGEPVEAKRLAVALRGRFADFVDLVTAKDVPVAKGNDQAHNGPQDPLICDGNVTACGQVLAIVLARSASEAINIAHWVQSNCVVYSEEDAPVLSLADAVAQGQKCVLEDDNIYAITRAGSQLDWTDSERATLDGVTCLVVSGEQMSHCPQMHFYFETQSAVATPNDSGGITVLSSTQNPSTILGAVSAALGLGENQVDVQIRRVGGGYGGKGPRSPWAAANAAIAARKVGRPVKIAMTREVDSALFGHESPLWGRYHCAIATGDDDPDQRGRLMGVDIDYRMDAGNTADCTPVVMDCTLLRADNGYLVPNYRTTGTVYLTNLISNTSFRSLDAVSGIIVLEDGLEAAAHAIGMLPEDVREKNLYRIGDFTPYGEVLEYCYLRDVWAYTKRTSGFSERLAEVRAFNRSNRFRKRGISLLPIKYGMGFNATFLERGDALVDIYDGDGTVIVRHGGCEIGQGINTQVAQLVAEALNVPVYLIQVGTTSTNVIPNPVSTGASTGTAFNGGAAQRAAARLRKRLEQYCVDMLNTQGRKYCADNHLDFWNYDTGWNTPIAGAGSPLMWSKVVESAAGARVNLSTQAQHNETGGAGLDTDLSFQPTSKENETVQQFVGYTYSAACSEVEVDILTGEVTILRADIVYDMGKSINPATDVGQIEGAFVQGVGRVLLEDVVWQPTGEARGTNNTPNTWGYKVPATTSIPLDLRVDLFPREDAKEVPDNPNLLLSAKEVGEPPLCLAATVYFAVKHAILDSRIERGKPDWFRLDMPCTVQRVRAACEVDAETLDLKA